jgi:hypothetical protein
MKKLIMILIAIMFLTAGCSLGYDSEVAGVDIVDMDGILYSFRDGCKIQMDDHMLRMESFDEIEIKCFDGMKYSEFIFIRENVSEIKIIYIHLGEIE